MCSSAVAMWWMKKSIMSRKNSMVLALRPSLPMTEDMSLLMYGENSRSASLRMHGSTT